MATVSLFSVLFLATVSITNVHGNDDENGISKEALLAFNCSDPDRPNFCRPYGSCCGHDEFCSSVSRGCVSCFPLNLQDKPDELLQWCKELGQFNASLMNSPACTVACQARFTSSQLYIDDNTGSICSVSWDDVNHILVYFSFASGIVILLSILGRRFLRTSQHKHRFVHKHAVHTEDVELGEAGKEVGDKECKEPSKLGAQGRPDSATSKAKTDEKKLRAVPTNSNQETQPLIDDGLANAMRSNDSVDSGVQTTSPETASGTSGPYSPEGNNIAKKTITDGMVFSPSESDCTDRVELVTNQTSYQNQQI